MNTDSAVHESQLSDCIIGLDLGGRLFYTHLSTLAPPGGPPNYFSARFGNSGLPAGASRTDDLGRQVYFLDRPDDLFRCILQFLRTGVQTWPNYADDPVLWNRLRAEAQFYMLEHLTEALKVTHSRSTENNGDQGVLYWLGTRRGKSEDYRNPCALNEVRVFDSEERKGRGSIQLLPHIVELPHVVDRNKRSFVQYHQPTHPIRNAFRDCKGRVDVARALAGCLRCESGGLIFGCRFTLNTDNYCGISFSNIAVRPTTFSIRYAFCRGMDMFNFEASEDGETWDRLHSNRCNRSDGKQPQMLPCQKELELLVPLIHREISIDATVDTPSKNNTTMCLEIAERNLRGTWTLENVPNKFYRAFRISGVGEEIYEACRSALFVEGREVFQRETPDGYTNDFYGLNKWIDDKFGCSHCLHGVGFEVFGDIQEE